MSYEVEIIADSVGPAGVRLTTFALKYPRMVHEHLLTHRAFSRNASSARAIPSKKMRDWVVSDPALPVHWGRNRPGMSSRDEVDPLDRSACQASWLACMDDAIRHAGAMHDRGLHKQIANRVIEPWMHINVLVSSTDFGNWFALRCHPKAQPEIQALAIRMLRAYLAAGPRVLAIGGWHMPYVTDAERDGLDGETCLGLSVARCCRVSYRACDGATSPREDDLRLAASLRRDGHWSPFEHQACCYTGDAGYRSGNFRGGWMQYRQMFDGSCYRPTRSDLEAIAARYGDRDYLL